MTFALNQALLAILDSPLNKVGNCKDFCTFRKECAYSNTKDVRILRMFMRFCGLMGKYNSGSSITEAYGLRNHFMK